MSLNLSQQAPGMGTHRVAQLKEPPLFFHCGTAKKNKSLNTHILDFLDADDLVDIDPQGNSSSGLGIAKKTLQYSVYNCLIEEIPAQQLGHIR